MHSAPLRGNGVYRLVRAVDRQARSTGTAPHRKRRKNRPEQGEGKRSAIVPRLMGRMPGPWDTVLTLPHQTTRTRRKRGLCIKFGFQERGFCILMGLVQDSLQELQVSLFLRACARIAVLKNNILDIYRLSYRRLKSGVSVAPGRILRKRKVGKM